MDRETDEQRQFNIPPPLAGDKIILTSEHLFCLFRYPDIIVCLAAFFVGVAYVCEDTVRNTIVIA